MHPATAPALSAVTSARPRHRGESRRLTSSLQAGRATVADHRTLRGRNY